MENRLCPKYIIHFVPNFSAASMINLKGIYNVAEWSVRVMLCFHIPTYSSRDCKEKKEKEAEEEKLNNMLFQIE